MPGTSLGCHQGAIQNRPAGLAILLPAWARDGGPEAMLERLADAATRGRLRDLLPERIAVDPGGPELIQISNVRSAANRPFVGKTLAKLAEAWETDVPGRHSTLDSDLSTSTHPIR